METLRLDTPEVSALARAAGLTALQSAWREGDTTFLRTPYGVTEVSHAPGQAATLPQPAPGKTHADDFTQISWIGTETALALRQAGYNTIAELKAAKAADLLPIPHVTKRIVQAIATHEEEQINESDQ